MEEGIWSKSNVGIVDNLMFSNKSIIDICNYQHELLKKLYDIANKLDLEYCHVINNYSLKPMKHNGNTEEYYMPIEYDKEWMVILEEVEKYLGIE